VRVLLTVDPEIPVPPRFYGGIERIVDFLVRGLLARGHEVTLFAHPDSQVPCELVPWPGGSSQSRADTLRNMAALTRRIAIEARRPDFVVHSFARVAYLLPTLPLPFPKIQTYQRAITPRSVRWGHRLSRGHLWFTACSASCARAADATGTWRVVHNGVPVERYRFTPSVSPEAPLVFLGRIEPIKGVHHAIEVARRTGRRLLIAGNVPEREPERTYAQNLLASCDGEHVRYVGPVDDAAKSELLSSAAAMLFPIEWEEPFGIVMAEALACGTPVIGMRRGSVPEVVEDGQTGFVCDSVEDMVAAVRRLPELQRARCRASAETRFSARVIVDQYEQLYRDALSGRVPLEPGNVLVRSAATQ